MEVNKNSLLYRSGDVFLSPKVRKFLETYHIGDSKSLVYVTNWSFVHFLSGIFLGWILVSYFSDWNYYLSGFWIHTVWELWQIVIGMTKIHTYRGLIDVGVDTLFFMFGLLAYSKVFSTE
jgi:hypothetical protein